MDTTNISAKIVEISRADYRRALTELFLNESSGAAGAPSKYESNNEYNAFSFLKDYPVVFLETHLMALY